MAPQKGIKKLKRLLEGEEEEQFSAEQYMMLYTCASNRDEEAVSASLILSPR